MCTCVGGVSPAGKEVVVKIKRRKFLEGIGLGGFGLLLGVKPAIAGVLDEPEPVTELELIEGEAPLIQDWVFQAVGLEDPVGSYLAGAYEYFDSISGPDGGFAWFGCERDDDAPCNRVSCTGCGYQHRLG